MTNLEQLQELHSTEGVHVAHVVSVPRSLSTAFEMGLAAVTNGIQVNEPINRVQPDDLELAAGQVMDAYKKATQEPQTVVSKIMAHPISEQQLPVWLTGACGIFFTIRSPRLQVPSLVEAAAADIRKTDTTLTRTEAERIVAGDISQNDGLATFWHSMLERFRQITDDTRFEGRVGVVDGTYFSSHATQVLGRACLLMHTPMLCSPTEGWKRVSGGNFINLNPKAADYESGAADDPWMGEARESAGVLPDDRDPEAYRRLPDCIVRVIDDIAMPKYEEIATSGL